MKIRRAGSTIVAVMITVATFSALLGVIVTLTQTQSGNSHRTILRAQALAYGDAVLESLFDQWRNAMITATSTADRANGRTNAYLSANLTPPGDTQLSPPKGISLVSWSVTAADPMLQPTSRADGRPEPEQGTNSRLRVRLYYVAQAEIAYEGAGGVSSTVTVERPFIRAGRNLFDNFFFGTQQETEFHPGAPMYVDGTVYVGGNLYTAHDFLTFLTDVSFLGSHTINYRTSDPRHGTGPTIDDLPSGLGNNWNPDNPPRKGVEQKLFDTKTDQLDANFLDDPAGNDADSDGNRNNDGYRELIETPSTGTDPLQLDPATSERLSENADYRIFVDAANNVTIYKGQATTPLATNHAEYVALKNTLSTNQAIKDVREADNVRVATMNVRALKDAADGNGSTQRTIYDNVGDGDGLLIYFADTSVGTSVPTRVVNSATGATTNVTSNRKRGLKLVDGGRLPSAGLTISTPNSVYVAGDYNTGRQGSSQPPSNTASVYTPPVHKPSPVTAGYSRVASAIAADAVNILSNAWNDANSLTGQSTRVAANTTVNTAIIAGNVPTTTSSYSGGIENFVRFHENWSGKYFTIYGTLASLFNSAQATGRWSAADYTPPNRRWFYDINLQDNNPPGFRVARVYERGRWTAR
jgi:hypothetical protein